MPDAIQVEGLTKVYTIGKDLPPLRAVDGIDFTVHEGEVFGFLGPNGAGKTSTIRMLTGLSIPTAGKVQILGLEREKDLPRIKKRIGVVPETSNLYDGYRARIRNHGHSCFLCEIVIRSQFHTTYEPEA
jgi:ABC-type multidrug transport system, ATPase component